jgi:hypothetical protein
MLKRSQILNVILSSLRIRISFGIFYKIFLTSKMIQYDLHRSDIDSKIKIISSSIPSSNENTFISQYSLSFPHCSKVWFDGLHVRY